MPAESTAGIGALVRSCFRDGAVVEGSRMTGPVDVYLRDLEPAVARYAATMHFMGNQLVDVEGDTGRCETYAVAYHWAVLPAGTPDEGNLVMAVRYLDSTVRVGEHGSSTIAMSRPTGP